MNIEVVMDKKSVNIQTAGDGSPVVRWIQLIPQ